MTSPPEVFFVTGEASGDRHAAPVVSELLSRGVRVTGIGGPRMAAAGAQLLKDTTDWGAMGVPESARRYPVLWAQSKWLLGVLRKRQPRLIVLVDFGFFNFTFARHIKRLGLGRVLYYFPPGSWRQEPRDWSRLASVTDCIATPFARNAEFLQASGANAHWVGHPAVDSLAPAADRVALRRELGLPAGDPLVGILPGSRAMERRALGEQMLGAAELIRRELPGARFLWSAYPRLGRLEARLRRRVDVLSFVTPVAESHDILRAADLVLVAMGTATLEAAAALTPMVCCYDGPYLGKWIAGHVLKQGQPIYAMPNILLGREAVPEIVPHNPRDGVTAAKLAEAALGLLKHPERMAEAKRDLAEVRQMLGPPGVAGRVADLITEMLSAASEPDTKL